MEIAFFTVGGTIDKIYFDQKSIYQVGESAVQEILRQSNVTIDYRCVSVMQKDSLDLTEQDRQTVFDRIAEDRAEHVVVTHGTDTMAATARKLQGIRDKVIVLTGAMEPAKFRNSDAVFNVGCAVGAVQSLPPGVYIAMNGRIFEADKVKKNVEMNRFEEA